MLFFTEEESTFVFTCTTTSAVRPSFDSSLASVVLQPFDVHTIPISSFSLLSFLLNVGEVRPDEAYFMLPLYMLESFSSPKSSFEDISAGEAATYYKNLIGANLIMKNLICVWRANLEKE